MKVILLKSVPKIGNKHDVLNVSEGYAMNALFPKGLAQIATPKAIARVEELKIAEEGDRKVREELLLKVIADVSTTTIEIQAKANDKGHLFAGLHKEELAAALKEQARIDIAPEYIELKKPIKEAGEQKITVKVQGKTAELTINIKATE